MKQIVEELIENKNVRANLSQARKRMAEAENPLLCASHFEGKEEMVLGFLKSEDAKTRKNAALLIGDLGIDAVEEVFEAYKGENTRFVKSSYLVALSKMNAVHKLPELRDELEHLLGIEIREENRKHVTEEIRELRKILIQYEGISRHTFQYPKEKLDMILLCNRNHRELIRRAVGEGAKLHPLGVETTTECFREIEKIRTYRGIVFPIHTRELLSDNALEAADLLWESDLGLILNNLHKEAGPFYYRIDCGNSMSLEKKSDFGKKLGGRLGMLSGGELINSASDYEIELRLIANREGRFFPCLKLKTYKDKRFSYRKNAISASIHPSTAALITVLAKPYLKENAQILDPFCGVGTMLVERNKNVKAREIYGIDIFGDAIEMARENSEKAKCRVNYIHRDFFDFKHDYLFDEIITNMPMRGKKTKEEMDQLYRKFFLKAEEVLTEQGIIIMYTNEMGLVKKQLRMNKKFQILQETCMQTKNEFFMLVMELKG